MGKEQIMRTLGKAKLGVIRHRSDILFIAGLGLDIAGDALLVKATYDSYGDIRNHKKKAKKLETKKEKGKLALETTKKLGKRYAPALIVKAAAFGCLGGSKVVDKKTITGLSATVGSLSATLASARKKVAEADGEEKAAEYFDGVKEKEVVEEDGSVTKEFEVDPKSEFVMIFDACNSTAYVHGNNYANRKQVEDVERWANSKLKRDGFLFVNDVRKDLAFEITEAGQIAGWIYDPENPDKQIDFGLDRPENRRFMDGSEDVAIIFLNCQPNILTKLHLEKY